MENIARWTEGILKLEKDIKWDRLKENNEARRKKYLKKIGVINLKKTSGGGVSNKDEVLKASIKNSDFLRKQIDIYKPDIIICCGTEEMVKKSIYSNIIIKWKITSRGIWYFENKNEIVISYSHPAAHIKASFLHYALMDAVREIVRKQESLI